MIRIPTRLLIAVCKLPWMGSALIALLIFVPSLAYSSDRDPSMAPYRSAAEVHALSMKQAQLGNPAFLRGVITQTTTEGLILQDRTSGIWIYTHESSRFTPGDLIEVEGKVEPGLFAPVVRASAIRIVGRTSLPEPKVVNFRQLSTGEEDDQFVSVTGVVRSVGVHSDYGVPHEMSLKIGMRDGEI